MPEDRELVINLCDGKYHYIFNSDGSSKALRYGQEWRDCTGDNLIYAMAAEIKRLQEFEWMYNVEGNGWVLQ